VNQAPGGLSGANPFAERVRSGKFAFVSPGVVAPEEGRLGFAKGFLVRDPDGHVMQLIER